MNLLSTFYNFLLDIKPLPMPTQAHVLDWMTWVFCGVLVLLTLIIVNSRRKFTSIVRALFSPRSRNQLLRESKPLTEWIYAFLFLFDFLVIGMALHLIISTFLPTISQHFAPFPLPTSTSSPSSSTVQKTVPTTNKTVFSALPAARCCCCPSPSQPPTPPNFHGCCSMPCSSSPAISSLGTEPSN